MCKGEWCEITGVCRASLETWLEVGSCGRYTWKRRWDRLECGAGFFLTKPSDTFPPPPQLLPQALPAWPAPFSYRRREEGGRPEGCAESSLQVGLMSFQHSPRSTGAPVSLLARVGSREERLGRQERWAGALSLFSGQEDERTASRQCGSAPGRTSHL